MPKSIVVVTLSLMLGSSFAHAKLTPREYQVKQVKLITSQLQKIRNNRKIYKKMLNFKSKLTESKKSKQVFAKN